MIMITWNCFVAIGILMMKIFDNIQINATSSFLVDKSDLDNSVYLFTYNIQIKNLSAEPLKLLTRHWEIRDALGNVDVVDGEGVIGEMPIIKSKEDYIYSSFCPLKTSFGSMSGFYTFSRDNGEIIKSLIPEFSLIVPEYIN